MSIITITIVTDNAAFDDMPAQEVAQILQMKVIPYFGNNFGPLGSTLRSLKDGNGNTVGSISIVDKG